MRLVRDDRFIHLPRLRHSADTSFVFVQLPRQSFGNEGFAVQSVLKILPRWQCLIGRVSILLLVRAANAKFEFDFGPAVAAGCAVYGGFVGAEVYFVFEDYEPFCVLGGYDGWDVSWEFVWFVG